jgi:hypothetical protein
MKKIILPIILCLAISSITASAAEGGKNEGKMPAKKSSAVVHNILSDRLPVRLQKSIRKAYNNYWITGLYKSEANGKTSYHITVENADQIVRLSATPSTKWAVSNVAAKENL